MMSAVNMFLRGPFSPDGCEESNSHDLRVEGKIPADLNGTLYRTSSAPYFAPPDPAKYHWFDGDGMIFAVTLEDGRASMRNRWVNTASLQAEKTVGHALYGSFINGGGYLPETQPGQPSFKNPGNTNALLLNEDLLVFCEIDIPHKLDPKSLKTLGMYDFGGIKGPVTAHFKIDPRDGEMVFFGANGRHINFYQADRTGKLITTHPFEIEHPCFFHDFAATEDYAIFFATPAIFDLEALMNGQPSAVWDPSVPTRIGVMERRSGVLRWLSVDKTFATTHFLNAYQEEGEIIVDVNCAPDFGARTGEVNPFSEATPWRWIINVEADTVQGKQMDDANCEFPRFDERLTGRKHRYGYYAATRTGRFCDEWLFDHLMKHDNITGERVFQNIGGELTSPGEPVFVPRKDGTAEDDGYVIAPWWNTESDETELVVQHAQDFGGEPLARVKLGQRIPLGFHGNWAPAT